MKGTLVILLFFYSLALCNESILLQSIIQQAINSTCQYDRYGINQTKCKEFNNQNTNVGKLSTPIYPGLSYDPFSRDGFTLPIYKPIDKIGRIFSVRKVNISDVCSLEGFNHIYNNFIGGNNVFGTFRDIDYIKLYAFAIDMEHTCRMQVENYILLSIDGQNKQFDDYFLSALKLLPELNNETVYSQFFKAYSPFVAMGSYGGSIIHTYARSENLGVVRYFEYTTVSGGNSSIHSDRKLWIESILSNPTMVDFDIVRMSQLIHGLVSDNVLYNIIEKEKSMISNRPDSATYEKIRESSRPCKMISISDLSTQTKLNRYSCPNGESYNSKTRVYVFGKPGTTSVCDKVNDPSCGPGSKVLSGACANGLQSSAIASPSDGPNELLNITLSFKQNNYWLTEYQLLAIEQLVEIPTGISIPNGNTLLGYCSPKKYRGMVALNRFSCSDQEWGNIALPYESYLNCKKDLLLCYVYPYGYGATSETLGKTRTICAEVFE